MTSHDPDKPPVLVDDSTTRADLKPGVALIVDDEADVADLFIHHLTRLGFRCHWEGSAEDALEVLDREDFTIAVVDLMLPGMDGIQLLTHIRAGRQADLPIIITSIVYEHAAPVPEADARLDKPFRVADFHQAVRIALLAGETRRRRPT